MTPMYATMMLQNIQIKIQALFPDRQTHLRLRDRGRIAVVLHLLSLAMLSVVQKCLDKKCSSSGVGWYGNWCSFSWDEQDDCKGRAEQNTSFCQS